MITAPVPVSLFQAHSLTLAASSGSKNKGSKHLPGGTLAYKANAVGPGSDRAGMKQETRHREV